jgi:dihydroneopterin aldolase
MPEFRPPLCHRLSLRDLVLWVHLGCSEEERSKRQELRLSAEFLFQRMPAAALTDNLKDTLCVGEVASLLAEHCETKTFHLIEKVGLEAYRLCKDKAAGLAQVRVKVHKVCPPLERASGGSVYECGDFLE